MNKKISDKDKEDWENFLNNKEKTPNKDSIKKKNKENPDKDKEDWENFLKSRDQVPNKDFVRKKNIRYEKIKISYLVILKKLKKFMILGFFQEMLHQLTLIGN